VFFVPSGANTSIRVHRGGASGGCARYGQALPGPRRHADRLASGSSRGSGGLGPAQQARIPHLCARKRAFSHDRRRAQVSRGKRFCVAFEAVSASSNPRQPQNPLHPTPRAAHSPPKTTTAPTNS
jgi:hypothetical protein